MLNLLRRVRRWWLRPLEIQLERLLLEQGRAQANALGSRRLDSLRQAEFTVFSQNGEDGILQYLCARVPLAGRTFVEFGVQDYRESNTRFLLQKDAWRGWILDGDDAHVRYVARESFLGQNSDLRAIQAFITRENIEDLLRGAGVPEDLDLLSVDIDGNDYWVFEAIQRVRPRMVVLEYNSLLGPELGLSVPYDPAFRREAAGPGRWYFGASLAALAALAGRKGYTLVGGDSRGCNAFFVRADLVEPSGLRACSVAEAWAPLSPGPGWAFPQGLQRLKDRLLVDPASGQEATIAQWYGL